MIVPTLFYSLVFYVANCAVSGGMVMPDLLKYLFPIHGKAYWFVTMYVALVALSPFLKTLLSALNHKNILLLVGCMLVLNCEVSPTIGYSQIYNADGGGSLAWFVTLFLLGGYVRNYGERLCFVRHAGLCFIGLSLLVTAVYLTRNFHAMSHGGYTVISKPHYNSVFTCAMAVLLLLWASRMVVTNKLWLFVAGLGKLTFGVYLIHDNDFVRHYLWDNFIVADAYYGSPMHLPFVFGVCVLIFLACAAIERFRISVFNQITIKIKDYAKRR